MEGPATGYVTVLVEATTRLFGFCGLRDLRIPWHPSIVAPEHMNFDTPTALQR
jgi:hypothetical protein